MRQRRHDAAIVIQRAWRRRHPPPQLPGEGNQQQEGNSDHANQQQQQQQQQVQQQQQQVQQQQQESPPPPASSGSPWRRRRPGMVIAPEYGPAAPWWYGKGTYIPEPQDLLTPEDWLEASRSDIGLDLDSAYRPGSERFDCDGAGAVAAGSADACAAADQQGDAWACMEGERELSMTASAPAGSCLEVLSPRTAIPCRSPASPSVPRTVGTSPRAARAASRAAAPASPAANAPPARGLSASNLWCPDSKELTLSQLDMDVQVGDDPPAGSSGTTSRALGGGPRQPSFRFRPPGKPMRAASTPALKVGPSPPGSSLTAGSLSSRRLVTGANEPWLLDEALDCQQQASQRAASSSTVGRERTGMASRVARRPSMRAASSDVYAYAYAAPSDEHAGAVPSASASQLAISGLSPPNSDSLASCLLVMASSSNRALPKRHNSEATGAAWQEHSHEHGMTASSPAHASGPAWTPQCAGPSRQHDGHAWPAGGGGGEAPWRRCSLRASSGDVMGLLHQQQQQQQQPHTQGLRSPTRHTSLVLGAAAAAAAAVQTIAAQNTRRMSLAVGLSCQPLKPSPAVAATAAAAAKGGTGPGGAAADDDTDEAHALSGPLPAPLRQASSAAPAAGAIASSGKVQSPPARRASSLLPSSPSWCLQPPQPPHERLGGASSGPSSSDALAGLALAGKPMTSASMGAGAGPVACSPPPAATLFGGPLFRAGSAAEQCAGSGAAAAGGEAGSGRWTQHAVQPASMGTGSGGLQPTLQRLRASAAALSRSSAPASPPNGSHHLGLSPAHSPPAGLPTLLASGGSGGSYTHARSSSLVD